MITSEELLNIIEATSINEAITLCLKTAIRFSEMDSGAIYLADEGTEGFVLAHSKGLSPAFRNNMSQLAPCSSLAQRLHKGESLYDLGQELHSLEAESLRLEGIRAHAITPVRCKDRTIACVMVSSHTMDGFFDAARQDFNMIAAQLGSVLGRIKTEEALKESENKFSVIFDGTKLGTFTDATKRQQVHQTDKLVSLGMLTAGVVHEINNPLSSVLLHVERLQKYFPIPSSATSRASSVRQEERNGREAIRDETVDYLDAARINTVAEHVQGAIKGAHLVRDIINDLKIFSRPDEDRMAPLSLNQVIETAVNIASNEFKYRAQLVMKKGDIASVLGNDSRLVQVFLNLLINAAHAIDEGDMAHNEIRVSTRIEGDKVLAEVRDTGKGIHPDHLDHIFEPFYTTKPSGVGTGLGLWICRNIVNAHGGRIDVESKVNKGTRFTIYLPIESEHEGSVELLSSVEEKAVSSAMRGRILLVDDDPSLREVMKPMLEKEHDVIAAVSGEDGKRILEQDMTFDVVLCDLMMLNVSGMDLYDWLIKLNPNLAKRMVFMTGGAFTRRSREFLQQISNVCLEKPIKSDKLAVIVRNLVLKHRAP